MLISREAEGQVHFDSTSCDENQTLPVAIDLAFHETFPNGALMTL